MHSIGAPQANLGIKVGADIIGYAQEAIGVARITTNSRLRLRNQIRDITGSWRKTEVNDPVIFFVAQLSQKAVQLTKAFLDPVGHLH